MADEFDDYDLSKIFARDEAAEDEPVDDDQLLNMAITQMFGGLDGIDAFSSMKEIEALGQLLEDAEEDEEEEHEQTEEEKKREEEAGMSVYNDLLKRMQALNILDSMDDMDKKDDM